MARYRPKVGAIYAKKGDRRLVHSITPWNGGTIYWKRPNGDKKYSISFLGWFKFMQSGAIEESR